MEPPFVLLSKRRNAVPAQLLRNWVQIPTSRIMSSGMEGFRSLQSFRPKFPEKSAPNKKTARGNFGCWWLWPNWRHHFRLG